MPQTAQRQFDLTDPRVLANPHPTLHEMRQSAPVYWSDALHGWVLTRYDDILAAFRDQRLSNNRMDLIVRFQLRNSDPSLAKDFERVGLQQMLFKDGGEHHRLRVLGNRGFTPSMLTRTRPKIQSIVDSLLDKVRGRGRMDVAADFTQPLPALVIAEMFGIPAEDRTLFQDASDAAAKFFGGTLGDPATDARQANDAINSLESYFLNLLEQRRQQPGDDLMSLLLAGQAEGRLSAQEVCAQCVLILVAGHVTTIDQMANAINAFLTHPDQLQRLRDTPTLITSAVEEVLRYDGAVPFIHRIAISDLEIGGQQIRQGQVLYLGIGRQGQVLYLGIGAANRDPAMFPNPDRFDIGRPENRHIAFAAGPHICIGAGLAKMELEIGLTTLFERLPNLRLDPAAPPKRRCESLVFSGFDSLPVVF
jgi:cytochrome P450 PksS